MPGDRLSAPGQAGVPVRLLPKTETKHRKPPKQAVAIALNQARTSGAKIPKKSDQ
jgi:hypothetical protein